MRSIVSIILIILLYISAISCEDIFGDYLEKAPGVDVTEDTVFSSKAQAELYLAACYEQALVSPWRHSAHLYGNAELQNSLNDNIANWICYSDEAEHSAPWWFAHNVNNGSLTIGPNLDFFYQTRWTALRMVHTMMERIADVPDVDETYQKQIIGEMSYLRAAIYFDMFRRHGGVPLISRRFKPTEVEAMKVRRSSLDSTVQFILTDLESAISSLPDVYPSNLRGRITKGAALALKADLLLYAASPLFNADKPFLDMQNPADNRIICYGNFDKERWQKAADAAKAVIDWAPAGNIKLIEDKGVDKNYRYVWETPDNAEIILADKHLSTSSNRQSTPWQYYLPRPMGGLQGPMPTQTFIEKFYDKKDGTPQTWSNTGNNLIQKYQELDWRFHQTVGYNGFFWNSRFGTLAIYIGPPAPAGVHSTNNKTGYWLKKFVPDQVNDQSGNGAILNFPRHRLAVAYLNYAEALNEAQGPVQAAYDAVNKVRARSGMPALPAGLTQDEFRQRIRKERGVELAFEGHRWWDIRRWKIGEETVNGPFYGLKIYKNTPITNPLTFRYERYVFETRVWQKRFYLDNFTTDQINLGYLVQNPGW